MKIQFLILVVLLVVGLGAVPPFHNLARAVSVGLVCLADSTSAASNPANPCPGVSGPVFNGPVTSSGHQIRIGVFLNGSGGLWGFDITLLTDHTVLKPAGADLAGTVLLGRSLVVDECLSGVLAVGSKCLSTDTVDTLHFVATSAVGLPATSSPTTGLLFTAIYNITGTTVAGGVLIGYQTGCAGSSVTIGACVTIADGSLIPVVETVRGGTFDNSTPPPFVTVTASPSIFGPEFPGTSNTATITATAGPGYPGLATDSVAFNSIVSTGVTATLSGTNPCATGGGSCSVTLTLSASSGGNYSVTVLAQYSTVDPHNFNSSTLVTHVTLKLIINDFAVSANPLNAPPVLAGITASSLVTLTSVNGFIGTVALSTISSTAQCGLSPRSVVVRSSASSLLSCSSSSAGNFAVTVVGKSGVSSHSVQFGFSVQDFAVSTSSSLVNLFSGSNESISLNVAGLNGFNQPINVSIVYPAGLTVTPTSAMFLPPGRISLSIAGRSVGVYDLNVTVSSSTLSHSMLVEVRVTSPSINGSSMLFGLSSVLFYSLFFALGVLVIAVVFFGIRSRREHAVSLPDR